jgi:hypothetical protein
VEAAFDDPHPGEDVDVNNIKLESVPTHYIGRSAADSNNRGLLLGRTSGHSSGIHGNLIRA